MPVVHIDIIKRPLAAKRKLALAVTDAIVDALGVSPESICIVINEMDKDQYATAGRLHVDSFVTKTKNPKST
ncbi:MAG: 4-oxalocrotonate tautomerase family protein [Alphaproteobacteria bacterium]|nr:4-oxalocrotonate tautomerase family protein [Alphaproteobacteria bacterium]